MGLYCSGSMCVGVTLNQSNTTHEITHQISRKLLRMDVLTSETCWAVNNEIIKQVTSSWSLFNYHRYMFKTYTFLYEKCPLFLSDFNQFWISSRFSKKKKKPKYQISWKYVQWEPSYSMRTDGRTDMMKLTITVAFRNSAHAPKKRDTVTFSSVPATAVQGHRLINLLKPTGNFTCNKVWHSKILHCNHLEFVCFLWISE